MVSSVKSFISLPGLLLGLGFFCIALFLVGRFVLEANPATTDLGANLSFIGFYLGFFPLLAGIALKFSEVAPAPVLASPPKDIDQHRASQATKIQREVLSDVTKKSYFKSAHMADALKRIGLTRRDEDVPRLEGYRETLTDGRYTLVLRFHSPQVQTQRWHDRQAKFDTFFGRDVSSRLKMLDEERVELFLTSKAS